MHNCKEMEGTSAIIRVVGASTSKAFIAKCIINHFWKPFKLDFYGARLWNVKQYLIQDPITQSVSPEPDPASTNRCYKDDRAVGVS